MMIRDREEVTDPYNANANLSNNHTNRTVHTPNPYTFPLSTLKKKKKKIIKKKMKAQGLNHLPFGTSLP